MQQHAGARHHHSGAERLAQALVQAYRHTVLIPCAEVDRIALHRAAQRRVNRPDRADQPLVPLHIVRRQPLERLQPLERPQRQVAATVRRHLAYL